MLIERNVLGSLFNSSGLKFHLPLTLIQSRVCIICTFLYFSACLQFVHVWDNKLVLDFTCLRGMDTWHQKVTRRHTSHTPSHEVKNHAAKSPEPWLPIDCLISACGVTRTAGDKITIYTLGVPVNRFTNKFRNLLFRNFDMSSNDGLYCNVLLTQALMIMCWPTLFHVSHADDVTQQNVRISGGLNPRADQLSTTSLSDQDRIQASALHTDINMTGQQPAPVVLPLSSPYSRLPLH